jgi:tRNA threonylcarbamoyladenosine biosynthesis protein TsaB
MLNVLALDTATSHAAVALAMAAGAVHVVRPDAQARHGRNLVPAIQQLLGQAGIEAAAIDLFAVGLGPGSYTGLRVGLTVAKMLAYAVNRPLVSFDSLEAIARNAPADALQVAVVGDAQRGDLYAADFAREGPGQRLVRLGPTRIEPLAGWAARLAPGTFVLGPGLQIEGIAAGVPPHARVLDASDEAHWPDGRRLLTLARELWQGGQRDDPWFLEPLYLRRSAAEDLWDQKARSPQPRS